MSEHVVELGRRAVAAKGWRWMPGASGLLPFRSGNANARWRVTLGSGSVLLCSEEGDGRGYTAMGPESLGLVPDLTDPATLGCLLVLVREAWGDASAHTEPYAFGGWRCAYGPHLSETHLTEASALVAALECAP